MNKVKKIILIPVYNDWKSLNKLLINLDNHLQKRQQNVEILVIDDNSTHKPKLQTKKFSILKKIKILKLKKNLGSQMAIAAGLFI